MKVHHAESISEAIDTLQQFFECDLYTNFRPEHKLPTGKKGKMEIWYRENNFENEIDFLIYLDDYFNILRKEIIKLIGKKKFNEVSRNQNGKTKRNKQ